VPRTSRTERWKPTVSQAIGARVRGSHRGFSMVELLGVLVVMGLIATLVTVNWRAILPKTELHSAVRTLASTLQSTRSEAIARNGLYRVEYDLGKHRYRVNTPFRPGGGLAASEEERASLHLTDLPDSVRFHRILIDGVDYTQGIVYVRFEPLGAASAHTVTLIQKPEDNYYTIDVQALTGLIDYREGLYAREPPKESDFQ
jgi:type II secretion system protein H